MVRAAAAAPGRSVLGQVVFLGPGVCQVGQRHGLGAVGGVRGGVAGGEAGGVGRAEVGAVAGEDLDPLLPGLLHRVGDQVGGVELAAAGHRNVGAGGAGVFPHHEVRRAGRGSLGAVHGAGVAELDVVAHVRGGQGPLPAAPGDDQGAVLVVAGHGPGVVVGDVVVAVVAAGRDLTPDPDPFPGPRPDRAGVVDVPVGDKPIPHGPVQLGDLLTGIRYQRHPTSCFFVPAAAVVAMAVIAASAWVRSAGVG